MDTGPVALVSCAAVEGDDADLTLVQAAQLAGRSTKTLRRAVHEGALPRRYVQTPYGAQLIFARAEVEAWTRKRERPRTLAPPSEHPTDGALSGHAEQRLSELAWNVGALGDRLAELERSLAVLRGDAPRLPPPGPSDTGPRPTADALFPLPARAALSAGNGHDAAQAPLLRRMGALWSRLFS